MSNPYHYTRADIGCYVDSARGIYMTDAIVSLARAEGATIKHDDNCLHAASSFESEFAGCEWQGEYEDEATDYLNEHCGVDGCYWGRAEFTGDFGLWPIDAEDGE